jgi:hypothetical protein
MVGQGNTYAVPSRLVGTTLVVRVRAEHLEGSLGSKPVVILPRLHGRAQHAINSRPMIWSLVRKPGAFAASRSRDDRSPTLAFRRAYDRLTLAGGARADCEEVRVLHLAATLSASEVQTALLLREDAGQVPTTDAVRDLVGPIAVQQLAALPVHVQPSDQLVPSQRCAHADSTGRMDCSAARVTSASHGDLVRSDGAQGQQREADSRGISLRTGAASM